MTTFEILPAGDAALVLALPERLDPEVNAWCVALSRTIAFRLGTSVRDVVVGYCSVTVYFDPLEVSATWLEEEMRALAAHVEVDSTSVGATIDIPVCYGGELGPDLADVAAFAKCSTETVIDLHTGRDYRVYLVGFVPGFAYLAELDPRISAPRRASPRTAVPAGSVAIANGQTGVYPSPTPGGWHIIGRTPVKPYDPDRPEPFLFRAGDRVRFHRIAESEWPSHASH